MSELPHQDSNETLDLLARARAGDPDAIGALLLRHRERLRLMVELRMADVLRARIDASDVIQEASIEAARRLPEYLASPDVPFFVWLRFLTRQKLTDLHRHHLGTKARDARREVSFPVEIAPEATTAALAARLLGQSTTPSQELEKFEYRIRLQDALNQLDPRDREVLVLRHFEQLSNVEAARELGLTEAATSKRYLRALVRLRENLERLGLDSSFV
ncbi:MAG TPA: sigma-70 family RNA polymerase sigma factor [Planctomycetota bacterium]|nr:sigma-70 family RNA polymerase sigma factor [Planctomycetota bacterium]